jgi:endonuclease/exonuclease/phosphatase family metal-dependent hydrolase
MMMRARWLIPVALLLFSVCLRPHIASAAVTEAPRTLTYVTFNLFHGGAFSGLNGNGHDLNDRLEMVAEELSTLKADVIGLQEASRGRERGHVAARLAARLGFHYVYAPANPRLFASDRFSCAIATLLNFEEGPAIVSRFPVVAWHAQELPRCGRLVESRSLLSATLATPWGPSRAFSAHTIGDPCQTRRVAEIVRGGRGPLPGVLMGDFNAVEDSPAIAAFTRDAGFIDAFRTANSDQPGMTVWQRIEEPTPTVRRRVDYIFVAPGAAVEGRVTSSRLVLNAPRNLRDGKTLWPSDHYGVAAEIEFFPVPAAAREGRRPRTVAGLPQSPTPLR